MIPNKQMTVADWYEVYREFRQEIVARNTIQNNDNRIKFSISPVIGNMLVADVKPLDCQRVLITMKQAGYCYDTVEHCRIVMYGMFECAVDNGIIPNNPVTKTVKNPCKRQQKDARVLTEKEQQEVEDYIADLKYGDNFQLVLETGIRTGELVGLRFGDVDWDNRMLCISRSVEYNNKERDWVVNAPKSEAGYRVIPLTDKAFKILCRASQGAQERKITDIRFADTVFVDKRGLPVRNNTYNRCLDNVAEQLGIPRFSMHTLRHTFATRCMERGMKPKILQKIMGHSTITITMDLYVHATMDEMRAEMELLGNVRKIM